jgi:Zn finger protein HypA/HybF involved in hydrogenase expression
LLEDFDENRDIKLYSFICIDCGYSWKSDVADVMSCPVCESKDVVLTDGAIKDCKESEDEKIGKKSKPNKK